MAKKVIGIRREDRNNWERRAPLAPAHISHLTETHGFQFIVQPSDIRYFNAQEYRSAGAMVSEDLSTCSTVFAVKEIPPHLIAPGKTYVFFSHTIKGQAHNMPILKRIMALGCTLIDYERIYDEHKRRLVFFGNYAGLAGMIDSLWALGRRLEERGFSTPFSEIMPAHRYDTLKAAQKTVSRVGEKITGNGLPEELTPMLFGFAGYGNVSSGAQEIFDLLPHRVLKPEDLECPDCWQTLEAAPLRKRSRVLYKVVFREEHMVQRRDGGEFSLQEYYAHPELYRSKFAVYVPLMTVLVNGIYWEKKYPRLVTLKQLAELYGSEKKARLQMIGDISCDVEGAIECTVKCTTPDSPIYSYNPLTGEVVDGVSGTGPVVLAVDNLPCELARESSIFFSNQLQEFVPQIVDADYSVPFENCDLSPALKRAVIVYRGHLTADYEYLKHYLP